MRIIYLHQYFLTPDMAGGTRSFEMARRLVAAGHEVHGVRPGGRLVVVDRAVALRHGRGLVGLGRCLRLHQEEGHGA